ncbi:MAG: hypothetical protein U0Y10_06945 [Spirosomataceae bacterium]
MKKLIAVLALLLSVSFATTAQTREQTTEQDIQIRPGNNSVPMRSGLGIFKFTFRNGQVLNAFVQDAAGKIMRFEEGDEATAGAPNQGCKETWCARYIYNKETMSVIILCMPCDLTLNTGNNTSAAVPIPAFMKYIRRSKTTEAN